MITASVKDIKQELNTRSSQELIELCLSLSKFKKENKELLTYLLFEASNEEQYIENIKEEIKEGFLDVNTKTVFYAKKTIRKILRNTKKYIRYSKKKETQIELLICYCEGLNNLPISLKNSTVIQNIKEKQLATITKSIDSLHEDLQFDYTHEIENLL